MTRIFDEDENGHIYAADMVEVLTNLGDRLTKSEARKLVQNADVTGDGRIDYKGIAIKTFHTTFVQINQKVLIAMMQTTICLVLCFVFQLCVTNLSQNIMLKIKIPILLWIKRLSSR